MLISLVLACSHTSDSVGLAVPQRPALSLEGEQHPLVFGESDEEGLEPSLVLEESDTAAPRDTGDVGLPWYADEDGDGFGVGDPHFDAAAPLGFVALAGDCDDEDARARPEQVLFFTTARPDGSWDFDCDGEVELGWARAGVCDAVCRLETSGWSTEVVPDCGDTADWITGCSDEEVGICEAITEAERTQPCR